VLGCGAQPTTSPTAPESPAPGASATASTKPEASVTPPATPLGDRMPLLGDRLRFRPPESAKIAPRSQGIMSADESDDEETRVVLVPGTGEMAKFVLLARESFVFGTGNVEADAKKLLGKELNDLNVESAKVGAGLSAVALVPKRDLDSHGALFVYGAVIERADKTMCELSFYITSDMVAERAEWATRAKAILASVEAGSGKLPGRTEHKLDTGAGQLLVIKFPRATVLTKQRGPDFTVYHLRELGKIGQSMPSVGIYVGGHPSLQFKQSDVSEKKVKKSSGRLLGKSVDWYTWTGDSDQISEAIAGLGKHDQVHVFVSGPAGKHAELRRVLEAMTVAQR
jgi:hypothetical protein